MITTQPMSQLKYNGRVLPIIAGICFILPAPLFWVADTTGVLNPYSFLAILSVTFIGALFLHIAIWLNAPSKNQAKILDENKMKSRINSNIKSVTTMPKITHNKKNVKEIIQMLDNIDELTMQFVRDLQKQALGVETLDEHQLLDAAKSVLDAAIPIVEQATGKQIEFVEDNY